MDFRIFPGAYAEIARAADRAVEEACQEIAADARQMAPRDTGELASSIRAASDSVTVGTDHWVYSEYGTAPHTIDSNGKKLSWSGASHPVDSVQHPGTPEVAYMRRATYKRRNLRGLG